MASRLSEQTSIFGGVFFAFKSLLGIEGQKNLANFACFPLSLDVIPIYRVWPIVNDYL